MSVVNGLKQSFENYPDKVAAICGDNRLTFRELDERVNRLSSALAVLGLTRTDRISVLSFNCHRFLELYYGIAQLGAVVVPINFRLQPPEIKYIVNHSGSKAIALDPALASLMEPVRAELDSVEHFILASDEQRAGYLSYE